MSGQSPYKKVLARLCDIGRGTANQSASARLLPLHCRLRFEPLEERRMLAVFNVTNLLDGPVTAAGQLPGSLRQAVFDANNTPGADTIDMSAVSGTLAMTAGEFQLTDGVTINGPGATAFTIDAQQQSRIFTITTTDVSAISGLTLTGGEAHNGGAILTAGNLTLVGCDVVNNTAAGDGGGIFVAQYGSPVAIIGCTVRNNSSREGGGIVSWSNLNVINSTISGNTAFEGALTSNYDNGGGGIASWSNLNVVNSTINDNRHGGILSKFVMMITGCTIDHNTYFGISTSDGYDVTITASTISRTQGSPSGFNGPGIGIYYDGRGSLFVTSSTISENSGYGVQGSRFDLFDIRYSTITGNGGGVKALGAQVYSSIIAGNSLNSGIDLFGNASNFHSLGYNLVGTGNAFTSFNQPGDQIGVLNPMLGPLADNGGPTKTHAPLLGSPAIAAGDPAAVPGIGEVPQLDQRGSAYTRVYDGRGAGAARIDIGAVEWQEFPNQTTLVVDTLADAVDGNYTPGHLSLREAIDLSNFFAGPNVIEFAPSLTSAGPATITLTQGELPISDSVTISGPGAGLLTINAYDPNPNIAGNGSRIFHIDDGNPTANSIVAMSGLALRGGDAAENGGAIANSEDLTLVGCTIENNVTQQSGGGIYSTGSLHVTQCTIRNNRSAAGGGGICNVGSLTITDSTVASNSADSGGGVSSSSASSSLNIQSSTINGNSAKDGGGIFEGFGTGQIINSTISGNVPVSGATTFGGGIYDRGGSLTIKNATITSNTVSGAGGGIYASQGGTAWLENSLIAQNGVVPDVAIDSSGGALAARYSLIGNASGTPITNNGGNQIGSNFSPIDPMLGPLADNGGPTKTHALLAGSRAIDAGDPAALAGIGVIPLRDQRDEPYTRVFDGYHSGFARIDIGAFEFQLLPNPIGDYDRNLLVDAGDYVLWRKTLATNVSNYTGADGSGNGVVGSEDHAVWREHFGEVVTKDTVTQSSSDIPKLIPDEDSTGVLSTLNFTATGTIEDISVTLDITHAYDSDLEVVLISPLGTRVTLFSHTGAFGNNFHNTVFMDTASRSITNGDAPYTGEFRPQESLLHVTLPNGISSPRLFGEDAFGTWKLQIVDNVQGDIGTLNSWSLTILAASASGQALTAVARSGGDSIATPLYLVSTIGTSKSVPTLGSSGGVKNPNEMSRATNSDKQIASQHDQLAPTLYGSRSMNSLRPTGHRLFSVAQMLPASRRDQSLEAWPTSKPDSKKEVDESYTDDIWKREDASAAKDDYMDALEEAFGQLFLS